MPVSDVLFQPGRVVASPAALDLLTRGGIDPAKLSVYQVTGDDRVYVETSADRSCTTIYLPEEY